jgi:hypothetical protein
VPRPPSTTTSTWTRSRSRPGLQPLPGNLCELGKTRAQGWSWPSRARPPGASGSRRNTPTWTARSW